MASIAGRNARIEISDGETTGELPSDQVVRLDSNALERLVGYHQHFRTRYGYPSPYHERQMQAEQRARKLLLTCLSPEQKQELEKSNHFIVTAKSGNRYQIMSRLEYNVIHLDENDVPLLKLCAGPPGVPLSDYMLAQKLWLENDEDGFLAVANRKPIYPTSIGNLMTEAPDGTFYIRGNFATNSNLNETSTFAFNEP